MAKPNTFNRWYGNHRDTFNEKRRERYRTDPDYRAKVLERNRRARREGTPQTEATTSVITVQGRMIQVYTIGAVSTMIGRTPQIIRIWEKKGFIPSTTLDRNHRAYTAKQAALLMDFATAMRSYARNMTHPEMQTITATVWDNWN